MNGKCSYHTTITSLVKKLGYCKQIAYQQLWSNVTQLHNKCDTKKFANIKTTFQCQSHWKWIYLIRYVSLLTCNLQIPCFYLAHCKITWWLVVSFCHRRKVLGLWFLFQRGLGLWFTLHHICLYQNEPNWYKDQHSRNSLLTHPSHIPLKLH